MEDRIQQALSSVAPHERLLLAVSGGADSVAMLKWFAQKPVWKSRIAVAHVNHQIRPDSEAVAALVKSVAGKYGIRFLEATVNVPAEIARRSESVEACARRLRYDALERMRTEESCAYVLTAHTLDDDAETVLMRLALGSSWFECTGIPRRRDNILRPFLSLSRNDLRSLLKPDDAVDDDPMNRDGRYLRVQARSTLHADTPNGAALVDSLAKHGKEVHRLNSLTARLLNSFKTNSLTSYHGLAAGLECLPKNLYLEDLDFIAVERACHGQPSSPDVRLSAPTRRRVLEFLRSRDRQSVLPLPNGCSLHRAGHKLWLATATSESAESQTAPSKHEVEVPYFYKGQSAGLLEFVIQDWHVREWRTGERFKPLHRRTRKISDWLADAGIHPALRPAWPVICNNDEIIAVPGLGVQERHATLNSSGAIRITWKAITTLDQ